jgi:hypothetical protein
MLARLQIAGEFAMSDGTDRSDASIRTLLSERRKSRSGV